MKETKMKTGIKRAALAAAVFAVVAMSGCATIENASWQTPTTQRLPGDSLGFLVAPDTSDRTALA
jgi:hypothetical protein